MLNEDIALASSTGYAARLPEAIVDMHSGNVISNKPVKVKLLNGFLDAKRLEISENGAVIRFDGGVAMTLHPDKDADKAENAMTRLLHLSAVTLVLLAPGLVVAQTPRPAAGPPVQSLLQGGQDKDQPVQIEAASLEVRDKNKMATFSGDVQVVQGDTTMKCQKLVVFYGQEVGIAQKAAGQATLRRPRPSRRWQAEGRAEYPPHRSARRRHRHHQGPERQRRSRCL